MTQLHARRTTLTGIMTPAENPYSATMAQMLYSDPGKEATTAACEKKLPPKPEQRMREKTSFKT